MRSGDGDEFSRLTAGNGIQKKKMPPGRTQIGDRIEVAAEDGETESLPDRMGWRVTTFESPESNNTGSVVTRKFVADTDNEY